MLLLSVAGVRKKLKLSEGVYSQKKCVKERNNDHYCPESFFWVFVKIDLNDPACPKTDGSLQSSTTISSPQFLTFQRLQQHDDFYATKWFLEPKTVT